MIKAYTIGMLEKYDAFEGAEAGADYVNGTVGTVASGKFDASATLTHVLMQKGKGDSNYEDFTVASGDDARVANLAKWADKQLQVSPAHIAYATSQNYASISAGTTLLTSDTNGKLATLASAPTTAGTVYLLVDKKINFDGNGVLVTVKVVA